MPYITYETKHYYSDKKHKPARYYVPPRAISTVEPKEEADFMPTKLVHITENGMEIVLGKDIGKKEYCAISYCWEESGVQERQNGELKRVDKGLHELIQYKKSKDGSLHDAKENEYRMFEGIILKICQQFNIKYIWYDQMCIDQNLPNEKKKKELRKMHRIYKNAYCTFALIPKFHVEPCNRTTTILASIEETEKNIFKHKYFERLWTLEEAILSKQLLFVGRNIHMYDNKLDKNHDLYILQCPHEELRVQQVLYHAHKRESTKEDDRVIPLLNLFPDIMDQLPARDEQTSINDYMIEFYNRLARKDIGILAFSKISENYKSTIQKYNGFLPSWTGVNGEHNQNLLISTKGSFRNYVIFGNLMTLTSKYISNDRLSTFDLLENPIRDLPPIPPDEDIRDTKDFYVLGILVQLPGASEKRHIKLSDASCNDIGEKPQHHLGIINSRLQQLSRFTEIKNKNLRWYDPDHEERIGNVAEVDLDNLTEDILEHFSTDVKYAMLIDISFKLQNDHDNVKLYYPIIKKTQENDYKAIGVCSIRNPDYLFSGCELKVEKLLIQ